MESWGFSPEGNGIFRTEIHRKPPLSAYDRQAVDKKSEIVDSFLLQFGFCKVTFYTSFNL